MQWYYAIDGEQQGPVGIDVLQELAEDGQLRSDSLVWREGLEKWIPFGEIEASLSVADTAFRVEGITVTPLNKPEIEQRLREGSLDEVGLPLAPMLPRFWAFLIDSVITGLPASALGTYLQIRMEVVATTGFTEIILLFVMLGVFALLVPGIYETWMVGRYRATLGKMLFRLEVCDDRGEPLTYLRAFGRFMAKFAMGSCCSYLPFATAVFDPEKRGLHDFICTTRVIER